MNTLTPYIDAYLRGRMAVGSYNPKSRRVVGPRLRSLSDHHGRRPLNQFTQRTIEGWLGDLTNLCQNSRSAYLASARQFTAWMVADPSVPLLRDPCAGIPTISRTTAVPRAQGRAAVTAILEACRCQRDEAIVLLMVELGLRRMEVAALRWEHYDPTDQVVIVQGKNRKERVLPVTVAASAALEKIRSATSGPVIESLKEPGQPVSAERVGQIVSRAMADAGVKRFPYDGVSAHALRHTAASDVLDACGDLRVVQQLLGHAQLSTTAIYLRRASADQIRSAMEGRGYRREPGEPDAA